MVFRDFGVQVEFFDFVNGLFKIQSYVFNYTLN